MNYSGRGTSYDTEGQNRDISVGLATVTERLAFNPINPTDPDILPGVADAGAMDGPGEEDVQQRQERAQQASPYRISDLELATQTFVVAGGLGTFGIIESFASSKEHRCYDSFSTDRDFYRRNVAVGGLEPISLKPSRRYVETFRPRT